MQLIASTTYINKTFWISSLIKYGKWNCAHSQSLLFEELGNNRQMTRNWMFKQIEANWIQGQIQHYSVKATLISDPKITWQVDTHIFPLVLPMIGPIGIGLRPYLPAPALYIGTYVEEY